MSEGKHTPGPWMADCEECSNAIYIRHDPQDANATGDEVASVYRGGIDVNDDMRADARLIAAAPDLLEAAKKLEAAETANANCPECEGEGVPELCEACFPLFDDARVLRRNAISKASPKGAGEP